MAVGRFAPSPTGALHLGNLRTALVAWLAARSEGSRFLVRMEDLDRVQASVEHERAQLADLAALGLDWDGDVVHQSERFDRYEAALAVLVDAGRTYPCYCSRREVREAAAAPHVPSGTYPGTCRRLTAAERSEQERAGRPAALRLDAGAPTVTVDDALLGPITAVVDDLVLRRNDGVPAYHLAVVVDDAAQGVEQVVRADDLASVAPAQRHLATLLGLPPVAYVHVPLVLGSDGRRLAKRDQAATLTDQATFGRRPSEVAGRLLVSLGQAPLANGETLAHAATRFDVAAIPRASTDLEAMGLGLRT